MEFDQFIIQAGQLAGFEQNGIRCGNLADVMKVGGLIEFLFLFELEAHFPGNQ